MFSNIFLESSIKCKGLSTGNQFGVGLTWGVISLLLSSLFPVREANNLRPYDNESKASSWLNNPSTNALKYVSEWSGKNYLNLNPKKCVQCMFSLNGDDVTDPDLKATINDNVLSTVDLPWGGAIMLRESLGSVCVYSFLNVINTCWVNSQICRGVRNTYKPLLFTSHLPRASKTKFCFY